MRYLFLGLFAMMFCVLATAQETNPPERFDAVPDGTASPFGGLSIAPTRVVLQAGSPSELVTLYNTGSAPVTYRIDIIELEALAEGGYADIPKNVTPEWSAAKWLRYAPRQVTLNPGERQDVRIAARVSRNAEAGEYRSHMQFSSIPTISPAAEADDVDERPGDGGVNVSVGLEYQIKIPVLLQVGALVSGAVIEDSTLETTEDGRRFVKITLRQTGTKSDSAVVIVYDAGGAELGLLRGISILPPLDKRIIRVPIEAGKQPARIVYATEARIGVIENILAETAFDPLK